MFAKLKLTFQTLLGVLIIMAIGGVSCVSVNIGPTKTEKSTGVAFSTPAGNFKPIKNERADSAWNNANTGSTIAFQSSCGDSSDAPLESTAQDLFAGFEQAKDLRNERIPFDGREAIDREIEGKVDGVMTRVRAVIYKKNTCTYVLTFIALTKNLLAENGRGKTAVNGDVAEFERFAASFKAP